MVGAAEEAAQLMGKRVHGAGFRGYARTIEEGRAPQEPTRALRIGHPDQLLDALDRAHPNRTTRERSAPPDIVDGA